MSIDEWDKYLEKNCIDYDFILKDNELLKEKIYNVYEHDFVQFKYNK
jgi:hypothetical protein